MYNHPFKPYRVQEEFMVALYETLQTKKVGIFESPTGTGKTLSLICTTLAWLRDCETRALEEELDSLGTSKMPEWAVKSSRELKIAQHRLKGETLNQLVMEAKKLMAAGERQAYAVPPRKRHKSDPVASDTINSYLPTEPEDAELKELLRESEYDDDTQHLEPLRPKTRIFFASRTHSQLQQLAEAVRMLKVPASWSADSYEPVRFVSLGSRKQLCVNPVVSKISSITHMNEKCAELGNGCDFRQQIPPLRNRILGQIADIEELAALGREMGGCPYYASRQAVPFCEVVTLPYQLLVQQRTRDALGLDLKDAIVVIDEAHNLVDTISGLHSANCSHSVANRALGGLQAYQDRVGSRLSARNRAKVGQLLVVLNSLVNFFSGNKPKPPGTPVPATSLFGDQADTVNVLELWEYVRESKLAFKVDSYLADIQSKQAVLGTVLDFLAIASDPLSQGKLFWDRSETGEACVKYLLLDPSASFQDVVEQSRCVVLAGGTMEPVSDFLTHLFPYLDPTKDVRTFSCGHIIPRESLQVEAIGTGVGGSELQFTFSQRGNLEMLQDLGHTLVELAHIVPAGLVVFFPGYKYLAAVLDAWKPVGLLAALDGVKRVFRESENYTADTVFSKYTQHIRSGKGAVLFAVVGGRLSEGINFSDDLARGVVMVGLPFPNAFSAEMVAKREHIEQAAVKRGRTATEAKAQARSYYENLAMRSVNQSVGRAIRHAKDYASIYLLDKRYCNPHVQSKLSRWVRDSLQLHKEGNWQMRSKNFFATSH